MIDPDKALVRTAGDDFLNLAVGEPYFLHRPLKGEIVEPKPDQRMKAYPPYRGMPELIEILRNEHQGQHVVVTNGAKQAILAGLYALKRMRPAMTGLYHTSPHWPTYPTMAALSGLHFLSDGFWPQENYIKITSSPNNPDGVAINSQCLVREKCNIWDAAYAHTVYGWDGAVPDHEISVWSAAKLLGLSGQRVGWLVTHDPVLADHAADYVEKSTSGVNVYAQLKVAATLRWMRGNAADTARAYSAARGLLLNNVRTFSDSMDRFCETLGGAESTGRGMFAWFKIKEKYHLSFSSALLRSKTLMVPGYACGSTEGSWYRASLGTEVPTLVKALEEIRYYMA